MTTSLDAREQSRGTRPGLVEGRVALVTRGSGAAICHELADQGAHVAAGFWHDHEAAEKFLADVSAEHPGQRVTIHEGSHRQRR
jgi:NAD(P)-dependent dehydrogenase (short-subunit alcohol dehydrogenase family)